MTTIRKTKTPLLHTVVLLMGSFCTLSAIDVNYEYRDFFQNREWPSEAVEIPLEKEGSIEEKMKADNEVIRRTLSLYEKAAARYPGEGITREFGIVSVDRLSSGIAMVTWQGHPDRFFSVQMSPDGKEWSRLGISETTMCGIGHLGYKLKEEDPDKFFRIVEDLDTPAPVSPPRVNPEFKDGEYGVYLELEDLGKSTRIRARSVFPGGGTGAAFLFIDGAPYWGLGVMSEDGSGICEEEIPHCHLTEGDHIVHVMADASAGTTPSIDEPGPYSVTRSIRSVPKLLRVAKMPVSDMRTKEIRSETADYDVQSVRFSFTYSRLEGLDEKPQPYRIEILDWDGKVHRILSGTMQFPGPGRIEREWDLLGDDGKDFPEAKYRGRMVIGDEVCGEFPIVP